MSYFRTFPVIDYDGVKTPDITVSTMLDTYGDDSFFDYTIEDGETPEMLADRIYKNAEYAVYILLMNNIIDPYEEWPISDQALNIKIADIYDNPDDIHHYENTRGDIVSDQYPEYDRVPVTNIQHEIEENDRKRSIRLLLPELISEMENQHRQLLRS